jgi:hypothetical protein
MQSRYICLPVPGLNNGMKNYIISTYVYVCVGVCGWTVLAVCTLYAYFAVLPRHSTKFINVEHERLRLLISNHYLN